MFTVWWSVHSRSTIIVIPSYFLCFTSFFLLWILTLSFSFPFFDFHFCFALFRTPQDTWTVPVVRGVASIPSLSCFFWWCRCEQWQRRTLLEKTPVCMRVRGREWEWEYHYEYESVRVWVRVPANTTKSTACFNCFLSPSSSLPPSLSFSCSFDLSFFNLLPVTPD